MQPTAVALRPYEAFVMDIVTYLVDDYDSIGIKSTVDDRGIFIELSAPQRSLGRLIGKKGDTIEAIKTLLRCYGQKHDMKLALKLVPNE